MRVGSIRGAICLLWLLGTLAGVLGVAPASAAEAPPYYASFGPDGTTSTGFEWAGPIAVDQQAELVYVIDRSSGALYKFDTDGNPVDFGGSASYISGNAITGLSFFAFAGGSQVAVDPVSHDIYVTSSNSIQAFHADGEPAEFTAGPGAGTNYIGGFGELIGLAVDVDGDIYGSDWTSGVKIFAHSGEPITEIPVAEAGNLAVATNGAVYVNTWSGTVRKYIPNEFPVTPATTYTASAEPLDPNSSNTVAVDPVTNDVYVAQSVAKPEIAWYDQSGALLGRFAGAGKEGEVLRAEGVAIYGAEKKVFVSNVPSSGLSQVEIFWEEIYEGTPKVESMSVVGVTADSTTLRAQINPGSFDTTYRFEYGLQDCSIGPCTSAPIAGSELGAGHKGINVSQTITGLEAGTTYHFRVVAENEKGDNLAEEVDHIFTTQSAAIGFGLSDSRAWEMVSPPVKHGALLEGALNGQIQAAGDGESLAYGSRGSLEPEAEGSRAVEVSTILGRRIGSNWYSKEIALPNDRVTEIPIGHLGEYKLFSRDLARALVEPRSTVALSSEATERTPYLRENTEPPTYTALVTAANVPPGTEFGGDSDSPIGGVKIKGANPELSHVVLGSTAPLVEGAPAESLYLWSGGELEAVSVLPPAEGGTIIPSRILGSGEHAVRQAISDEGSRIFWSTNDFSALYLRDAQREETMRIDVVQSGATGLGKAEPIFQGASADGTVVFFTDSQQLTEDASPAGQDLYRCEIPLGSSAAGCTSLIDVSAPVDGSGKSAEVQGLLQGVSADGSSAYFVASAVLEAAPNEYGDAALAGQPNLYLWQRGEGLRFIASLSKEDARDWGGVSGLAATLSAAISPHGRFLAFMSQLPLADQNVVDAEMDEAVEEVYRYDAVSDRLDCVSCPASGAAPRGQTAESLNLVDPRFLWQGRRVAANLPESTIFEVAGASLYSPRVVLENGRIFFNSIDSLVAADSNNQWDVYQYEPAGIGDCTGASEGSAVARTAGGCVSLISSGTGETETGFLDASETGNDVFFLTPAQLSGLDEDSEYDVYDARVNGVPAIPHPRVDCSGESCQPKSDAPNELAPTSSIFEGPGNVKKRGKRCPKGKRKVHHHGKTSCRHRHSKHKQRHRRPRHGGGVRG